MRFTARSIEALSTTKDREEFWEDNGRGLGIRVSRSGGKSWVFMYRFDGKPRRMTFGKFPQVSLADAHQKRADALKRLEEGVDPGAVHQGELSARRVAPTVAEFSVTYIEQYARPRKRSWEEDERILQKDVLPKIGRLKIEDVRRRDILNVLDSVSARGAPIAANRTLAVVRKMFNYALGRDVLQANPCQGIDAPARENARDRILTEEEIRTFWLGLDNAGMSAGSKLALKFQLITAQRKGEIVSAEWTEFDLPNRMWTIPAAKAKNRLAHRVPLSDMAMNLLEQIHRESEESQWLFPSPRGNKHVIDTSVDHALRGVRESLGIADITPHDLRRTAASFMTSLGVDRLVVSKILNHVESGITAVYDRHSYDNEKRAALDHWGRKLGEVLSVQVAE